MLKKNQSIEQFVKEQIKKWDNFYSDEEKNQEAKIPVITVATQPGSGGSIVAQEVAKRLDLDYFHRDIVVEIAKTSKIRSTVINTLEKERLTGVQDFVSSLIEDQYIHPGTYLRHLIEVINTIAKHGRAVIVGRGASFILPPENLFAVRVTAPLETRIRNVALAFRVTTDTARRRITNRESRRKAFVRRSFDADISDPIHYHLTINTGKMSIETAVEAVVSTVMRTMIGKRSGSVFR